MWTATHRACVLELEKRCAAESARADTALNEVHWLRRQMERDVPLSVAPSPAPQLVPAAPRENAVVSKAIASVAGTNSRLRAHLWAYAEGRIAAKHDMEAIANSILTWDEDEDDHTDEAIAS